MTRNASLPGANSIGRPPAWAAILAALVWAGAESVGQPPEIQPAPTSVALFVGAAAGGPVGEPVHVVGWRGFQGAFGVSSSEGDLGSAVRLYFLNGGQEAWVARVEAGRTGVDKGAVTSAMKRAKGYNLMCLPGVTDREALRAALKHCEEQRALLLVDLPADCNTSAEAKRWLGTHEEFRNPNVAAYLPWVGLADAGRRSPAVPPSGAIAGVIARTDRDRGVWHAPAGPEAELRGVVAPPRNLNVAESEALTALGVNCLRTLPDGRLVVWGARTLAVDPEWRYVSVRRLFLFIEESISEGTQWAVFEPNDAPLWQALRANITPFMNHLFRQGAFQGARPQEAYFVKCGAETTTDADRAQGVCNIVVGFAPVRPAEFVIIRIQQKTAGSG